MADGTLHRCLLVAVAVLLTMAGGSVAADDKPPRNTFSARSLEGVFAEGELRVLADGLAVLPAGRGAVQRMALADVLELRRLDDQAPLRAGRCLLILDNGARVALGAAPTLREQRVRLRLNNREHNLDAARVHAVHFAPLDEAQQAKLLRRTAGVLLAHGDFFEGEIRSLSEHGVEVDSVLFGVSRFAAGKDVLAAVLRPAGRAPTAAWMVRDRDGSQFQARSIDIDRTMALKVDDEVFGEVLISADRLSLLQYRGPRVHALLESGCRGLSPEMPRGVSAAARTHASETLIQSGAVEIPIAGRYGRLLARLSAPRDVLPTVSWRLIFRDGDRMLLRTDEVDSISEPATVNLDLRNVKTLRVEVVPALADTPFPPAVLWLDPVLISRP